MRTHPKAMILRRVIIVAAAMGAAVAVFATLEVLIDDARRAAVVLCAVDAVVLDFTLKDVEGVGLVLVIGFEGNAVVVELADTSGLLPKEAGGPSWAAGAHAGDCVWGPRV